MDDESDDIKRASFLLSDFTDYPNWYEGLEDDYTVEVAAYNKGGVLLAHEYSVPFSPGIPQLSAPANVQLSNTGMVTWTASSNAEEYRVKLFCKEKGEWIGESGNWETVKDTECDYSEILELGKEYLVTVQAGAAGYRFSDSTKSNSATCDVSYQYSEKVGWSFFWHPFAGATRYNVKVYERPFYNTSDYFVWNGFNEICKYDISSEYDILLEILHEEAFTQAVRLGVTFDDPQDCFYVEISALDENDNEIAVKRSGRFSTGIPKLSEPENVYLSDEGVLSWKRDEKASDYYLTLYCDDLENGIREEVKSVHGGYPSGSFDFSSYMQAGNVYHAAVQAYNKRTSIPSQTVKNENHTGSYHGLYEFVAAIPEPLAGDQPVNYGKEKAVLKTNYGDALELIGSVEWYTRSTEKGDWKKMNSSDYFADGQYYAVSFNGALKGYALVYPTASLNGKEAAVSQSGDDSFTIWYDMGKLNSKEISYVNILLADPETGKSQPEDDDVSFSFSRRLDSNEFVPDQYEWSWRNYDQEDIWHEMEIEDTYEPGKVYRLEMSFLLYGCKLKPDGVLEVNGMPVPEENVEVSKDGTEIYLYYTWGIGTPITSLSYTTVEPVEGEEHYAETLTGQNSGLAVASLSWQKMKNGKRVNMEAGETFKYGETYYANLKIKPRKDCYFTYDTVVSINGKTAVQVVDDAEYREYVLEMKGIAYISSMEFTVDEPVIGEQPSTKLLTDGDLRYTASLSWQKREEVAIGFLHFPWFLNMEPGEVFSAGAEYRPVITVKLNENYFYSKDLEVKINGKKAYDSNGAWGVYNSDKFSVNMSARGDIPYLSYTVTEPADGALPSDTVLPGAESEYAGSVWLIWMKNESGRIVSMEKGERFVAGVEYWPQIKIIPEVGCQLTDDTEVTINGKTATIGWNYEDSYWSGKGYYTVMYVPDTYYDVWVEGIQISSSNRHDVLKDGGSVKYLTKEETGDENTLVLTNAVLDQTKSHVYQRSEKTEYNPAVIYTEEKGELKILLAGINTITRAGNYGAATGIAEAGETWKLTFVGDGSLTIDSKSDYIAIDAVDRAIEFTDSVNVTAKGMVGIDNGHSGDESLVVSGNASLYAYAYQMENGADDDAIKTGYLDVRGMGTLTAETQYNGQAINTWSEISFKAPRYEIRVLDNKTDGGEYVYNGIQPYVVENFNNFNGGAYTSGEWNFRYVSIRMVFTLQDVSRVFRWWNGKEATLSDRYLYDVNNSGDVDLRDAAAIYQVVAAG